MVLLCYLNWIMGMLFLWRLYSFSSQMFSLSAEWLGGIFFSFSRMHSFYRDDHHVEVVGYLEAHCPGIGVFSGMDISIGRYS